MRLLHRHLHKSQPTPVNIVTPLTISAFFELSGRLVKCGASPVDAATNLYEQESFARIKLLQKFFDSMTLEAGGKICIGTISEADYDETGATTEDLEGVVDYARSIEGVEIGVLIEDRGGRIKEVFEVKE